MFGEKTRRIAVTSFVWLGSQQSGPAHFAAQIAAGAYRQGRLGNVFCLGRSGMGGGEIPDEKCITPPNEFALKLMFKGVQLLARGLPIGERLAKEAIFDYFVSQSSSFLDSDIIFFTKEAFLLSARVAKKRGIPTVAWAPVFHPKLNCDRVQRDQVRLGFRDDSDYTDRRRVDYLSSYFSTVDHIVVGTQMSKRSYVDNGICEQNISVLPYCFAVDMKRFRPLDGLGFRGGREFKILHMSHMDVIKGVHNLAKAYKCAALNDATLILGGSIKPQLAQYIIGKLGINAEIIGPVTVPEDIYKTADIFVCPSLADSFPYAALEAMSSGLPVLVSDGCGVSEIIQNGINGFVFPHNDTDGLTELLRWCANNRGELARMGVAARATIERYTEGDLADEVINILQRC